MQVGFSLDARLGLAPDDELALVKRGAALGYESIWTPATSDAAAFESCLRWYQATGLPVGISVVPAHGQPPEFYADHARRLHDATGGKFFFGVGSGQMAHAAPGMREYLARLRRLLPNGPPIYLAALGPLMLRLAGQEADGVSLNWCSEGMVAWSRSLIAEVAEDGGRPLPVVSMYIRTCVDPDPAIARDSLGKAALTYALGPPAYRKHFERMGFTKELKAIEAGQAEPTPAFLGAAGAAGAPGQVRSQFYRIAAGGLDVAVLRVLSPEPGAVEPVERALVECAPAR